jgi:hyperosmotically inducible protein
MRTLTLLILATLLASGAGAAGPTPTPGPASRVGGALDEQWGRVSESVSEALLIVRIRVALLERLKEDGLRVTINARDGAVELSGQVEKRDSAELAGRVAGSVDGVRSVKNRVTVATDVHAVEPPVAHVLGRVEHTVADALLEARVKGRLLGELGKVAFRIGVDATSGVVTLSGTVPDAERQKVAAGVAKATSGVKEVRDQLTVQK